MTGIKVSLLSTALAEGQASKAVQVHLDCVVTATTKTQVLEDLLKHT
jgi:hypothetical protein